MILRPKKWASNHNKQDFHLFFSLFFSTIFSIESMPSRSDDTFVSSSRIFAWFSPPMMKNWKISRLLCVFFRCIVCKISHKYSKKIEMILARNPKWFMKVSPEVPFAVRLSSSRNRTFRSHHHSPCLNARPALCFGGRREAHLEMIQTKGKTLSFDQKTH